MAVQLIKDDDGKAQYVVIPYDEYFRMCLQMAEIDDETDDDLEDIEVEHDCYDDVGLPGEVCDVMHNENVSLQAAWRILRGMSQQEVAEKLGISQSAVSQLEALDSRPQSAPAKSWRQFTAVNRSRSASIYQKRVNSTSPRPYHRSGHPGGRGKILRRSWASGPGD